MGILSKKGLARPGNAHASARLSASPDHSFRAFECSFWPILGWLRRPPTKKKASTEWWRPSSLYPVRDLNPCYRRERAASWAARRTGLKTAITFPFPEALFADLKKTSNTPLRTPNRLVRPCFRTLCSPLRRMPTVHADAHEKWAGTAGVAKRITRLFSL